MADDLPQTCHIDGFRALQTSLQVAAHDDIAQSQDGSGAPHDDIQAITAESLQNFMRALANIFLDAPVQFR